MHCSFSNIDRSADPSLIGSSLQPFNPSLRHLVISSIIRMHSIDKIVGCDRHPGFQDLLPLDLFLIDDTRHPSIERHKIIECTWAGGRQYLGNQHDSIQGNTKDVIDECANTIRSLIDVVVGEQIVGPDMNEDHVWPRRERNTGDVRDIVDDPAG